MVWRFGRMPDVLLIEESSGTRIMGRREYIFFSQNTCHQIIIPFSIIHFFIIHFFIIPFSTTVLSSQKDSSIVSVTIWTWLLCFIENCLKNDDFIDKIQGWHKPSSQQCFPPCWWRIQLRFVIDDRLVDLQSSTHKYCPILVLTLLYTVV